MPTNAIVKMGFATKLKIKVFPQVNINIRKISCDGIEITQLPFALSTHNPELIIEGIITGNAKIDPDKHGKMFGLFLRSKKTEIRNGMDKVIENYNYFDLQLSIKKKEKGVSSFSAKHVIKFNSLNGGLYGVGRIEMGLISNIPYVKEPTLEQQIKPQEKSGKGKFTFDNRIIDINKPSDAAMRRGAEITFEWNDTYPILKDIYRVWIDIYHVEDKRNRIKRLELNSKDSQKVEWKVGDGYNVNYGLGAKDFYYKLWYVYEDKRKKIKTTLLEQNENFVTALRRPTLNAFRLKHRVERYAYSALLRENARKAADYKEELKKIETINELKRMAFGSKMHIEGEISGYADGSIITVSELRLYKGSDPQKLESYHTFEGVSFTINRNSFKFFLELPDDKAALFYEERCKAAEGIEAPYYMATLRLSAGKRFNTLVDVAATVQTGSHEYIKRTGKYTKHLVRYHNDHGYRACSVLLPRINMSL